MKMQSPTQKAGGHASLFELSSSDDDESPPAASRKKKDAERQSPTQDSEDNAGAGARVQHNLLMRCRLLPA